MYVAYWCVKGGPTGKGQCQASLALNLDFHTVPHPQVVVSGNCLMIVSIMHQKDYSGVSSNDSVPVQACRLQHVYVADHACYY